MITGTTPDLDARDERLQRVVVAYLEAVDAGKSPDPVEWVARHPDLVPELAEFFEAQDHLHRIIVPLLSTHAVDQGRGDRPGLSPLDPDLTLPRSSADVGPEPAPGGS